MKWWFHNLLKYISWIIAEQAISFSNYIKGLLLSIEKAKMELLFTADI